MKIATFREWLRARGCSFEQHRRATRKVTGSAAVTVRRGQRSTELPLVGSRKRLPPEVVQKAVSDLGLDPNELPGPRSRA